MMRPDDNFPDYLRIDFEGQAFSFMGKDPFRARGSALSNLPITLITPGQKSQ